MTPVWFWNSHFIPCRVSELPEEDFSEPSPTSWFHCLWTHWIGYPLEWSALLCHHNEEAQSCGWGLQCQEPLRSHQTSTRENQKDSSHRVTFKHMLLCAHSQEDKGASKRPVSCTNFAGMTLRGTPSPIHTDFVCMSQPQTSRKAIGFFHVWIRKCGIQY